MLQATVHCKGFSIYLHCVIFFCASSLAGPPPPPPPIPNKDPTLWDAKDGPRANDVTQHKRGDCWLDSVMSSIAYTDPGRIKNMMVISPKDNFAVTVTLNHRAKPTQVVVQQDVLGKDIKVDSDTDKGNQVQWPSAIEEAFIQLQGNDPEIHDMTAGDLWGGSPSRALKAIYGDTARVFTADSAKVQDTLLWKVVSSAPTTPVTACTTGRRKLSLNLPGPHAYSVQSGNEQLGTVTLRNPWGLVSQKKIDPKVRHRRWRLSYKLPERLK